MQNKWTTTFEQGINLTKIFLGGIDSELSTTKRVRTMEEFKKKKSIHRWNLKRIPKYEKKWAENRLKRAVERKEFQAKVKDNPDWFYYHEINYWVERKTLMNDTIRNNIHLILHNPTFSNAQKREGIDYLIKLEEMAKHVNPKLAPDELPRRARQSTPDTACDPDMRPKFPMDYKEMMAQAEAAMIPEEIPRRYFPSENKPRIYAHDY